MILILFQKYKFFIVLISVVLIQALLVFQGFDVCDEGFSLTFYQQMYNNPASVEYNFVYWLSGIIGGIWYEIYPNGGVLWFRFLAIIFNAFTFIACHEILKKHIRPNQILIGLAMVTFVNSFGPLVFYHNHLTQFIAILSICFLIRGLTGKKLNYWMIWLSGVFIGVNIFARIPNATLLIFFIAIPYKFYLANNKLKESIKPIFVFIGGSIIGGLVVVSILYSLDQIKIMNNALSTLFTLGSTKDSGHNFIKTLFVDINNYKSILTHGSKFFVVTILLLVFVKTFKKNKIILGTIYLVGFFLFVYLIDKGGIHIVYSLGFVGIIGVLFLKNINIELKIISLLALLMMTCLPIGSGGGIKSSGYMCVWLVLPLFLHVIFRIEKLNFSISTSDTLIKSCFSKSTLLKMYILFVFAYFSSKAYAISNEAYFDKGSRFKKVFAINNKFAMNVFTTNKRATIINDLLENLTPFVNPGDYLFTFDNIPMVHFLTETKPYMYNPWVWIYDSNSFRIKIGKAEKEISVLPIVVQQKFETIFSFSEPMKGYMDENKENSNNYNKKRTIIMNDFLNRNQYEIIWSNDYFNIYKSSKN